MENNFYTPHHVSNPTALNSSFYPLIDYLAFVFLYLVAQHYQRINLLIFAYKINFHNFFLRLLFVDISPVFDFLILSYFEYSLFVFLLHIETHTELFLLLIVLMPIFHPLVLYKQIRPYPHNKNINNLTSLHKQQKDNREA